MTTHQESIQKVLLSDLPEGLKTIHSPPKQLYVRTRTPPFGDPTDIFSNLMQRPRIAIVGTRRVTAYGRAVTSTFAAELAARGVVIISGLAYGVDAIAHRAALDAGGLAIAVLPTPVESVYPSSHRSLADRIVSSGGAVVSEYPAGTPGYKQNFVARNRIVTGLANSLLITEAAVNSGTMHTARFALDQGIDVLAVPGNITSPVSAGTNNLIKSGAAAITSTEDILHALGLQTAEEVVQKGQAQQSDHQTQSRSRIRGANQSEQAIIDLLEKGIFEGSQLLMDSGLTIDVFSHHLTMLEITAKIRPLGANQWTLS